MNRIVQLAVVFVVLGAAGCQNWDMLEPEPEPAGRTFTRLGDDGPEPLTNAVAIRRVEQIKKAIGQARLELVESFIEEFPEARFIPEVHQLRGEGHLAVGAPAEASEAFERALVLTRTDLLGIPLESELPLQLGMAMLSAGRTEEGLGWLARASVVDHSGQMDQALHWAHSQQTGDEFDPWLAALRGDWLVEAPAFTLPGLLTETVDLERDRGKATLINFWSPT